MPKTMPQITLTFAGLLILLGVVMFIVTGAYTSLIPAVVGGLMLLFGLLALKSGLRMHAMHGAVLVGLLGFLAAGGRLAMAVARGTMPPVTAFWSLLLMLILTGVFVAFCVRSFIQARRKPEL